MATRCPTGDSWFPKSCKCAQQQNAADVENYLRSADYNYQKELDARSVLTSHLQLPPPDGPSLCQYHYDMARDLCLLAQDHGLHMPATASAPKGFAQTIVANTALLPLCKDCTVAEGISLDRTLMRYQNKDTCTCATRVIAAMCWYCELGRIEASKQLAIEQRTVRLEAASGVSPLKCGCGKCAVQEDSARKCAGCGGVKTAPYSNFAANQMAFMPCSTAMRTGGRVVRNRTVLPDFANLTPPPQAFSRVAPAPPPAKQASKKRTALAFEQGDDIGQKRHRGSQPEAGRCETRPSTQGSFQPPKLPMASSEVNIPTDNVDVPADVGDEEFEAYLMAALTRDIENESSPLTEFAAPAQVAQLLQHSTSVKSTRPTQSTEAAGPVLPLSSDSEAVSPWLADRGEVAARSDFWNP